MEVKPTKIEGLLIVTSEMITDRRGFFRESYRWSPLAEALGRKPRFRQNNHSRSSAGVLRGLHTEAWDKLFYVVRGTALCVVADARPDSSTFGKHERFLLGDTPGEFKRIFACEGLSNGFYCLTEVDYINDVSEEFDSGNRGGIKWSDETLGVEWPDDSPILSEADANLPSLKDIFPDHPIFAGG